MKKAVKKAVKKDPIGGQKANECMVCNKPLSFNDKKKYGNKCKSCYDMPFFSEPADEVMTDGGINQPHVVTETDDEDDDGCDDDGR